MWWSQGQDVSLLWAASPLWAACLAYFLLTGLTWRPCWPGPLRAPRPAPALPQCAPKWPLVLGGSHTLSSSPESCRAPQSIGVRTIVDFRFSTLPRCLLVFVASLPSGFCSKAESACVCHPLPWGIFSPGTLVLTPRLSVGFFPEPRLPKARPELCCPLLGWPVLSLCPSHQAFLAKTSKSIAGWHQGSLCGSEDIKPQISHCSRLQRGEVGDVCSLQVPLAPGVESPESDPTETLLTGLLACRLHMWFALSRGVPPVTRGAGISVVGQRSQ